MLISCRGEHAMSLIRPDIQISVPEASYSWNGEDVVTIRDAAAIELIERLRNEMLADDAERRLGSVYVSCFDCEHDGRPTCPVHVVPLTKTQKYMLICPDWRPRP